MDGLLRLASDLDTERPRFDYADRIALERALFRLLQRLTVTAGMPEVVAFTDGALAELESVCLSESVRASIGRLKAIREKLGLIASGDPYVVTVGEEGSLDGRDAVIRSLAVDLRRLVAAVESPCAK